MAPKRRRTATGQFASESGGSVTGGTGDIKPQILNAVTPQAVAADFATVEVPVPRIILGSRDQATVMEILKVYFTLGLADLADPANSFIGYLTTQLIRVTGAAASFAAFEADVSLPTTFASATIHHGAGSHVLVTPIIVDLTDNNGNGVLIATDRFFFTMGNVAGTLPTVGIAKILYRMVNVSITEYVGIVQSQI